MSFSCIKSKRRENKLKNFPKIFCISSGKGGVGKTLTVIHLAIHAAKIGKKVLLIDGDMGLSNVDVVLGLTARYNVGDVCSGRACFSDILIDGPFGIKIASSGSGLLEVQKLSNIQKVVLKEEIKNIEEQFDLIIIDTGSGIGNNVLFMNNIANKSVVVTTPEPHALTDGYALIKVLSKRCNTKKIDLIINQTASKEEGQRIAKNFRHVCKEYLQLNVNILGSVPEDKAVQAAIRSRSLSSKTALQSGAASAWFEIGNSLLSTTESKQKEISYSFFNSFINQPPSTAS